MAISRLLQAVAINFLAPVTEITQGTQAPAAVTSLNRTWRAPALVFGVLAVLAAFIVWFALHWPSKPVSELTQERVTFDSSTKTVVSAAISPNGKYVAYSESGGIHIKLLSTGEERVIRLAREARAGSIPYVDSWFPDGTQVLGHSIEIDGRTNIWIASFIGDSQRELRRDGIGWQVSPDGTEIAFSPSRPFSHARELWLMNAEGGNARKILDLGETGGSGL
jgi:Tol biopolymer transport system component